MWHCSWSPSFNVYFLLQCLNNGCLLTRGALPDHERLTTMFCTHIQQAREAQAVKEFAEVVVLDLKKVLLKVTDETLEKELTDESSDGEIHVYKLPGGNLAVPLLGSEKRKLTTDYVHLRNLKCDLEACAKGKSKLHTIVVKGVPVCRHIMLGKHSELM